MLIFADESDKELILITKKDKYNYEEKVYLRRLWIYL